MHQATQPVKHCLDHGVFHSDIHTSNILVNLETLCHTLGDSTLDIDIMPFFVLVEQCRSISIMRPFYRFAQL